MNLFGKKKAAPVKPVPNAIEAITALREQMDTLEKREQFVQKKIEGALTFALEKKKKGDINGAKIELKRKQAYSAELLKLGSSRVTLDMQCMALEGAATNVATFKVLESSNAAMKKINSGIDVDKVEDVMNDLDEQKDIQDSMSEAISRPCQDIFDDEDLAAELDALGEIEVLEEQKEVNVPQKQVQQPTTVFNLPEAPKTTLQKQIVEESEDDRIFRELQESMTA